MKSFLTAAIAALSLASGLAHAEDKAPATIKTVWLDGKGQSSMADKVRSSIAEYTDSRILYGGKMAVHKIGANGKLCIFRTVVIPFIHPGGGCGIVG